MKITKYILMMFVLMFGVCDSFADDEILKAMRDEMKRTVSQLRIENLEKPYYVEYSLIKKKTYSAKASDGAVNLCDADEYVRLSVNIRVGDYSFDNSNFMDFSSFFFGSDDDEERFSGRLIPLDADYQTLRRELWLATDAAYKAAVETYAKKVASLKNRLRKDTTPDFTRCGAFTAIDTLPMPKVNVKDYADLCRDISEMYTGENGIYSSSVSFECDCSRLYYLNSEGVEMIKNTPYCGIEIAAFTQASDGMPYADFYSAYALDTKNLPGKDSLRKANRNLINSMKNIAKAGLLDEPYSGPILFSGQAAAEIFSQVFAPQLITQRDMQTEQGKQSNSRYSAFQNKIGGRVLPEFMSAEAKPQEIVCEKSALFGCYKYDDQGVKAQDLTLVKDGYLKNLFAGRTPTKRVKASNGHFRGSGPIVSNLFVTADDKHSKTTAELKKQLLKLCKDRELPYGIVVTKIMNPNIFATVLYSLSSGLLMPKFNGMMSPVEAYKIYPDGREELLRGTDLGNLTAQSFKDVINCGKSKYVLNYYMPSVSQTLSFSSSRYSNSSVIVPDLLFEDAEIKPNEDDSPKLPLYASPR